jgi:hypothetical protein
MALYKYWDAGARKQVRIIGSGTGGQRKVEDEEGNVYMQFPYQLSLIKNVSYWDVRRKAEELRRESGDDSILGNPAY